MAGRTIRRREIGKTNYHAKGVLHLPDRSRSRISSTWRRATISARPSTMRWLRSSFEPKDPPAIQPSADRHPDAARPEAVP
jgi:hypothetical protein